MGKSAACTGHLERARHVFNWCSNMWWLHVQRTHCCSHYAQLFCHWMWVYTSSIESFTHFKYLALAYKLYHLWFSGVINVFLWFLDTPRNWNFVHTMSWVLNLFGIFFILAAHEHYSIDVFIAFYITTRLFLYYHTLANTQAYQHSRRARIWFPLFSFFECNVTGPVPNEYSWPFSKPAFIRKLLG